MVIAIAGSLLVGFAMSTLAYRYHLLRVPGEGVVRRMDRELALTQAQHIQIVEIMQDTRFRVMQTRREFMNRRRQLFWQARDRIRAVLTPEQQAKFDREFVPREMIGGVPTGPPLQPPSPPTAPPPQSGVGPGGGL